MVDIKWTPAAGAGSLRFTKRARDALGEDYSQWLDDGADAADAALEVSFEECVKHQETAGGKEGIERSLSLLSTPVLGAWRRVPSVNGGCGCGCECRCLHWMCMQLVFGVFPMFLKSFATHCKYAVRVVVFSSSQTSVSFRSSSFWVALSFHFSPV